MAVEFVNLKYVYDLEMYYSGHEPEFSVMMEDVVELVQNEYGKFSITYKVERSTFIVSWTETSRVKDGPDLCVSFYGGTAYKAMFKLWVFLTHLGGGREGIRNAEDVIDQRNAQIRELLKEMMLGKRP